MIYSHKYGYVYIGIPRTGSKSMNHWLCEHFEGENCGSHHDYNVPEWAADYLVFTVVRNPYDRTTSGHFAVTWDDQGVRDEELAGCADVQQRLRRMRAILKTREKQLQRPVPLPSSEPLEQRIAEAVARNEANDHGINQKRFVERAGVQLVLYFERLPLCLHELPFVDPESIPPFPHHPERGIRPSGDFFQYFGHTDEEQVVWAYAAGDFEAFGYQRYNPGLPAEAPHALWIRRHGADHRHDTG